MAGGEPRKSGGEIFDVCPKHFVPWVLTPVMVEIGVMVEGGCHFSLVTRAHFCRAVMMWGGSIRELDLRTGWAQHRNSARIRSPHHPLCRVQLKH